MISQRKLLAVRNNGSLSRGPKTPEGKARSSRNATRHGLLAKCVLLPHESRENFEVLLNQYIERFGPLDAVEEGLIEEMVAAFWRIRRAWAMEEDMLDEAVEKQPPALEIRRLQRAFSELAGSGQIGLLHRYESRLSFAFQRALVNLAYLQHRDLPNEPKKCPVSNETAEISHTFIEPDEQ